MTDLTHAAASAPGLILAAGAVVVAGPAGLLAALRQRGWRPWAAMRGLVARRERRS
jgi:hypothetical protein